MRMLYVQPNRRMSGSPRDLHSTETQEPEMACNDLVPAVRFGEHGDARSLQTAGPVRIAIQRWGFSEPELRGVLADCHDLDDGLEWKMADERPARADAVVHLVDAVRLAGESGGAAWNAMGPVQAMRNARHAGRLEVALVSGSARHLPMERAGCWILAGSRGLANALATLVRATLGGDGPERASGPRLLILRELATLDASCILLQYVDADIARLAARIRGDLASLVDKSYAKPAWLCAAGPEAALDAYRSDPELSPRRVRLTTVPGEDARADVVVAFAWPDLAR